MPVKIRRKKGGCYSVSTPGGTKARCTTKGKADAQARLLRGIEHGMKPSARKAARRGRKLRRRIRRAL